MTAREIEKILIQKLEMEMRSITEYGVILPETQKVLDEWKRKRESGNGNN